MRANGAWHQIQQILEIVVIGKRQIRHLLALELGANVGAISLQKGCLRSYRDDFLCLSRF